MKGVINVPYKNNNINGIFHKIAKITKSKNIYRDGLISFYSSSIDPKCCFDVLLGSKDCPSGTEWVETLGSDPDPWITIDFLSLKLKIEGISLYMEEVDYLPYYEILVSNDNATWENVGNKTFATKPSSTTQCIETTKKEVRFIKLHGAGQRFGGGNLRMAIYELDLFGQLSGLSLFRESCKLRRKENFLSIILIEILIARSI